MKLLTTAVLVAVAPVGVSAAAAQSKALVEFSAIILPSSDVMQSAAATHIAVGDSLVGRHKYRAAREQYRSAVDHIRSEGGFPGVALYRVAKAYYFEGQYQHAIRAFDHLAEEAAKFGDLVTEAWAVADAAWVAWAVTDGASPLGIDAGPRPAGERLGGKMELERRLERLRRLLASPRLPEDVRTKITTKRCGSACP
jgi:tetratricopeptide (TPR) repeat protein